MTVLSPARSQQPLITTTVPIATVATSNSIATGTATTLTTSSTTITLGHVGLSYAAGGSVSSNTIMATDNSNLMMRLHESIKQKEEFLKSPLPNVQQQQQSSQYMQMQHFFPSTMLVSGATTLSSSSSPPSAVILGGGGGIVSPQQLATLSSSLVTSTCCASSTYLSVSGTVSSAMLPLSNNNNVNVNVNLVTASRGQLTQSRNLSGKRSSMAVNHYYLPHSSPITATLTTTIATTTTSTTATIQSSSTRELLVTNCDIHYPSLVMTSSSNNNNNNSNGNNNSNKNYNKTMTTMMTMPLNRSLQFQRHTINGSVIGKNVGLGSMVDGGYVGGGVGSSSILLHSANNISNIHRNIAVSSMSGNKTITGAGSGTILRDKAQQLFVVDDGSSSGGSGGGGLLETMASTSTTLQETGVTNQV